MTTSDPFVLTRLDAVQELRALERRAGLPWIGAGGGNPAGLSFLDTIVEPGFDLERVLANVKAQPMAASVLVDLLRLLPDLSPDQGLEVESLAYAVLQGSAAHEAWLAARKADRDEPSQPHGNIVLSRADDVLTVTLDRELAGNAIDRPMRDSLSEAFALANADDTIRRVILAAKGKAFSLGADLGEFGTTRDPARAHWIRQRTLPAREAVRCANRLEAHIDGACIGAGLELAAFASQIVATRRSWFQLPELAMGILPGAGGCVSLTGRIGRQRTALMILSGRRVSARLALEWGLVDMLVDDLPA